ncbi:MAG: DUF935 family protein [Paracoccaceae bacterium]
MANIAGDCAAIIPETMSIEFVENKSVGASSDLYERRADWLDRQISKAVLGQTTTTDAVSGGHAVSKEHRKVQEDIERADAKALAGILNQDLVRTWVQLEFGARPRYPRIIIARPEAEDLTRLATSLAALVPLGLRVSESEVRDRFGFSDPKDGEDILGKAPAQPGKPAPTPDQATDTASPPPPEAPPALQAAGDDDEPVEVILADQLAQTARPAIEKMIGRVEAMLDAAGSMEEFRSMLLDGFDKVDPRDLAQAVAQALVASHLAGRVSVMDESGGDD